MIDVLFCGVSLVVGEVEFGFMVFFCGFCVFDLV